jgi:opacity protein-like surface antigen
VFVRAEWEYIKFLKVKDMTFNTNTARLGVGYKF